VIAHRNQFNIFLNRSRDPIILPDTQPLKKDGRKRFLHSYYLNRLKILEKEALGGDPHQDTKFIPALALLGIGLGYHIELFMAHYDIQNLIIYDPIPDIFYASLHLINFKPVLKLFTSGNNLLLIKVDGTPDELCKELSTLAIQRGSHTISLITLYQHYNSAATNDALIRAQDISHRLAQGWRFPEDEMMSLAHSTINTASDMAFMKVPESDVQKPGYKNILAETPVFIIANGPSLDEDIEHIRFMQNNVIIFSAGSTLVTLYNAGITPDFQIDIERSASIRYLHEHLHESYLEQVAFLTLNTTHPSVISLFPKHAFCLKAIDAGTALLSSHLPEACREPLRHCNSLAGNGAIAFTIRLGFKNLKFFGLDMGAKDLTNHHASGSCYYTKGNPHFQWWN
jgi:hypothetical protein